MEYNENGNYFFNLEDARFTYDLPIKKDNGIGAMLVSALLDREEIGFVTIEDDCFNINLSDELWEKMEQKKSLNMSGCE